MKPWKQISKKTILDHSKFLKVEEHCVELPDGTRIKDWPWIVTPDYVNVLAVDEDGKFIFFRQLRYSIGEISLAPVGGYIEKDEDPMDCAKRELHEETGYQAPDWTALGSFLVDSNRGVNTAYFFLAENAKFVEEIESDDLEESKLILMTRKELDFAIDDGEIRMLGWMSCVQLGLRELDKRQ